jgi:phosphoenolpyruvate carboxykinase (GTP)
MIEYVTEKGNGNGISIESLFSSIVISKLETLNPAMTKEIINDIRSISDLTGAGKVVVVDGTESQTKRFMDEMESDGTLIKLNPETYPNSYLHRSSISDVARTEKDTYICTEGSPADVGPTNNWMNSEVALGKLWAILKNSMVNKTMYVVPYWLGPYMSPYGSAGFQFTDSLYVVANLNIITRSGIRAVESIANFGRYVLGIHATASLDPDNRYIAHFPDKNAGNGLIISVNTNYGGNALLSKKCHALRISSILAKREGWMAEHMMLTGISKPDGKTYYIAGAFPSSSGKTNLSMIEPPDEMKNSGWKSWLISDDITWMHEERGSLYGLNPEFGFFGVVPHTSFKTNPNAMITFNRNTIFTNVAVDDQRNPYWEGLDGRPAKLIDWTGKPYIEGNDAAHPNSRFTTPISQYPHLSPDFENPRGVPIAAFLYGGRRRDLIPLVYQALSWEDGVLIGAMQRVETTAAAVGKVGVLRNDPMAIRPFLAYNMADYFRHHLEMRNKLTNPPAIFNVNWFRKDEKGHFLWPGYSNNMYVLNWIIERSIGKETHAIKTPIGYVPDPDRFDCNDIVSKEVIKKLTYVDKDGFLSELNEIEPFFKSFGERFPAELWDRFYKLRERLESD